MDRLQDALRSHQAGDPLELTLCGVETTFRYCPPGTFLMGSPNDEEDREENETLHEVTLTRGFWFQETPVTQALWLAVMGTNPSEFNSGASLPVENVNWSDCAEFIARLNAKALAPDGLEFDFPTEAEWEYACRAGTTTAYWFGDRFTELAANASESGLGETTPVKSFPPNAWGLYDMTGNVCEWLRDWYAEYSPAQGTDPAGAVEGEERSVRGGCWNFPSTCCRSACRDREEPTDRDWNLGFRLLLRRVK